MAGEHSTIEPPMLSYLKHKERECDNDLMIVTTCFASGSNSFMTLNNILVYDIVIFILIVFILINYLITLHTIVII